MRDIFIRLEDVNFSYKSSDIVKSEQPLNVLKNININLEKGQFIAILGRNGSGKSTFAKLLNGLIIPTTGRVNVFGIDTRNTNEMCYIRQFVGMIFQNPDNQIISTTVEEDVAFGLENLGVPTQYMQDRIDKALEAVDMCHCRRKPVYALSGGQKQRLAIAGVLAMEPECIVLDEATSMLDPLSKKSILKVVRKLNSELKKTIIYITHDIEEAIQANRILILDEGKIVSDTTVNELLCDIKKMETLGVQIPQITNLFYKLYNEGYVTRYDLFNIEEALTELKRNI